MELLHPADKVTDEEAEEESSENPRCNVGLAHRRIRRMTENEAGRDRRLAADGIGNVSAQNGNHHRKARHAEVVDVLPELIARNDAAVLNRARDEREGEHHTAGDDDRQEVGDTGVEIAEQLCAEACLFS